MRAAQGAAGGGRAVWFVDGDDATLVGQRVRSLVDELVGPGDRSLVVEDFRGDELDLATVAVACQTPPFLSDRRVVVVRDIGRFSAEEAVPLIAYLDAPLETTSLVLAAGAGRPAAKLTAAVKAHGQIIGTAVSGRDSAAWVKQRLRQSPVHLDPAAESLVESHLGEDIGRLTSLIEILVAAYGEGARLGSDDVELYLGDGGAVAPWDFTDAIDQGDTTTALVALHRLLDAGDRHPLVVASILHRHLATMLRLDDPAISTEVAAANALGIAKGRSTYPAKKALTSVRRYGGAGVAEALTLLADAELDLKGASGWPSELVLEVLVARLCRLARARRPATR